MEEPQRKIKEDLEKLHRQLDIFKNENLPSIISGLRQNTNADNGLDEFCDKVEALYEDLSLAQATLNRVIDGLLNPEKNNSRATEKIFIGRAAAEMDVAYQIINGTKRLFSQLEIKITGNDADIMEQFSSKWTDNNPLKEQSVDYDDVVDPDDRYDKHSDFRQLDGHHLVENAKDALREFDSHDYDLYAIRQDLRQLYSIQITPTGEKTPPNPGKR